MTTPESASSLLAATACWTAAVRAQESARPDALLHDPWAADLAGQVGREWIATRPAANLNAMVLRMRYFDDFLQRVTRESAVRQVVLLAAGLDTRAFRLAWPAGTRLFELDQPAVLQHKQAVLDAAGAAPACARSVIARDLGTPWTEDLLRAGFAPGQPSLWLLEGFLFYLPTEQMKQVLGDASGLAAPGSWLGCDVINSLMLTHPLTRAWVEMQAAAGAPWIGTLDEPRQFLAGLGWRASLSQAGQPEANHGRWTLPVLPSDMPNIPHNWFVTAEKLAA